MSSDLIFWICAAALLLLLEVCLYIGLTFLFEKRS